MEVPLKEDGRVRWKYCPTDLETLPQAPIDLGMTWDGAVGDGNASCSHRRAPRTLILCSSLPTLLFFLYGYL